jgi:cobalt-zinc-cadmium efflux system membrane fusion protein
MKQWNQQPGRGIAGAVAVALACGLTAGCQPAAPAAAKADASAKPAGPSKVTGAVKEADLAKLELTDQAEKRLGVEAVEAKKRPVPRAISYGGEVMIPPGRLISVASPFLGTVEAPSKAEVPLPGSHVEQGQPIFVVRPILSPEARANLVPLLTDAEGQVKTAEEQLKITQTALERAETGVRQKLVPQAVLVDARANHDVAQATLNAAKARRDELLKIAGDPDAAGGGTTTLTFKAPVKGILQNIHAQVGQPVPAGALLFDVAELNPIWVKVPVYVGDLERLALDKPAGVGSLADPPGVNVKPARPVTAPPSGDPIAYTAHLFYEVDNKDRSFRPGQRVGVTLPIKGDAESLAVPRSALIRDALGGTWVYENIAPHVYTRRRVFVDRVVGDLAALTSGVQPGAKVVSQAAAELYGAEFGGQK